MINLKIKMGLNDYRWPSFGKVQVRAQQSRPFDQGLVLHLWMVWQSKH